MMNKGAGKGNHKAGGGKASGGKGKTAAKEKAARERKQQLVEDVEEPIITSPSVTRWRAGKFARSAKNQGMRITCARP